jgi:IclR family transcriptional regulator, KDG regulon repressor
MARPVPAVVRTLDILELFLDRRPLPAQEIVGRLELPPATVRELLDTLVARSYLVAEPGEPTRYRVGLRLFQLGSLFAEQLGLAREAERITARVAEACDETVQVAILDGTDVVSIARAEGSRPVRMVSTLGHRLPAHCTSLGKVLLSGLDAAALDDRYPSGAQLSGMTGQSITSPAVLRAQLAEVRASGLAYDDCESNEAVHCVAAPVHDHTGAVVAAMSISVPTLRWSEDRREELTTLIRTGAATLSQRLGHQS